MNRTFTHSRAYFWSSLAFFTFFCSILLCSTVGLLLVLRPAGAICLGFPMGVFWSIWAWLSWRRLRSCWRDKVAFRDGQMELTVNGSAIPATPDQIEYVDWTLEPDNEDLRLDFGYRRIKIEFGTYDKHVRGELIQACRDAIPHELQRGWIADPDSPQERQRYAIERTTRRLNTVCIIGLLLTAFLCGRLIDSIWTKLWLFPLVGGGAWLACDRVIASINRRLYGATQWQVARAKMAALLREYDNSRHDK